MGEFSISDTDSVSNKSLGRSSSFALGMDTCAGQVAGVVQIYDKGFSKKPDACLLVASLSCDSELQENQVWQNVSQHTAISLDPELPINPVSQNIWQAAQVAGQAAQHRQDEIAKSSISQWCPLWPSIGVGSVLVAISVKVMF